MSSATCAVPSGIPASAQLGMSVTSLIVRSRHNLWSTPRTLLKSRRNQLQLRLWPPFQQSLLLRGHSLHLHGPQLRPRHPTLRSTLSSNLCRPSLLYCIPMPTKYKPTTGVVVAPTVLTRTWHDTTCIHSRATIVGRARIRNVGFATKRIDGSIFAQAAMCVCAGTARSMTLLERMLG
jgi:hypothetical protein